MSAGDYLGKVFSRSVFFFSHFLQFTLDQGNEFALTVLPEGSVIASTFCAYSIAVHVGLLKEIRLRSSPSWPDKPFFFGSKKDSAAAWLIYKATCEVSAISSGFLSGTDSLLGAEVIAPASAAGLLCGTSSVFGRLHASVTVGVSAPWSLLRWALRQTSLPQIPKA